MTSNNAVMKNLFSKNKIFLFGLIGLFIVVLSFGIQKAYAYYHDSITTGLLANKVGDFDLGDGDVNVMIYRENDEGKFVRVYAVPSAYYVFNDELTSCTIPCNDGLGNCEYKYDEVNKAFELTSNKKITCKFYFEKETESDINVYVLVEDASADDTYTYNSKTYALSEVIPAYGYVYTDHYTCTGSGVVTYNSETKKISVATGTKDTCYVYFDKVGNADVTVNTYVQDEYGSETYTAVNSIPANKIYTLNESKSKCTPVATDDAAGEITYTDGYINVSASGQQVCDVYLDLESN